VAKFRYGLHAFLSTKRTRWEDLDTRNAVDWIRNSVGEEAWQAVWRPLFDYKFYQYSNNLSAAWIWSGINRVGRSRYNLMREKLGYLDGGSESLLQAMAAANQAGGGEIRLSTPVQQVITDNGNVSG